ncbi:MAG TPA: YeeE/YedE thiosulfate transporter family protein [Gemmatimonadota bacterium]|nr:YeeE/YedE thiosulfate transporter family protein [Gemmatimonadota bacterium]
MAALDIAPATDRTATGDPPARLAVVLVLGIYLGIVLVKSEAVSWFRIQEMFRFGAVHMYGILASAVLVAGISVALIRRLGLRGPSGEPAAIGPKETGLSRSRFAGGAIFGCGWALLGACPGPIYALIGAGVTVLVVALVSAIAGAWVYGHLRDRLPH